MKKNAIIVTANYRQIELANFAMSVLISYIKMNQPNMEELSKQDGQLLDEFRQELLDSFLELIDLDPPKCRQCGCTEDDCSMCIEAQGFPCHWAEENLCSRCAAINDSLVTQTQNLE